MWPLNSQLHQDLLEEFRGHLMTVYLKDRELEYLPIAPKFHWVKTVLKSSVSLNFQDSLSWKIRVSRAVKKILRWRREEMSILELGLRSTYQELQLKVWQREHFFLCLKFIIERKKKKTWIFGCCCSVTQPCPTLWGPMESSIFTISWSLLKHTSI